MYSKFLPVLFSMSALLSFGQIPKKTFYDFKKTQPDEVYFVNNLGQNNGLYTKYDAFGAKAVEANYKNGLLHGAAKEYFRRGPKSKLKISGNYKDDKKDGVWTTYTYVKDGESYLELLNSWGNGGIEESVFNLGVQTKFMEEVYSNGDVVKETRYHMNGKVFQIKNFGQYTRIVGDFLCNNDKGVIVAKGKIGTDGFMQGDWIVPREISGDCPSDKDDIDKVVYTQKLRFDSNGNLDTNYISKSYYLSGKLRDSAKVIALERQSSYGYNNKWILCGKNKTLNGPYKSFHENGKLQEEGTYALFYGNSRKFGSWKKYDDKSNLISDSTYINPINKFTDERNNLTYTSIQVGTQTWMSENLNVGIFANGDTIPEAKTKEEWERANKEGKPAWCFFNNDPSTGSKVGRLYNWFAANDPRGLAPKGWHVPTDKEWKKLIEFAGGEDKAGFNLKSSYEWKKGEVGSNSYLFNVLPGAQRSEIGEFNDSFNNLGQISYFWSYAQESNQTINSWGFMGKYLNVDKFKCDKGYGFSLRCVKD